MKTFRMAIGFNFSRKPIRKLKYPYIKGFWHDGYRFVIHKPYKSTWGFKMSEVESGQSLFPEVFRTIKETKNISLMHYEFMKLKKGARVVHKIIESCQKL